MRGSRERRMDRVCLSHPLAFTLAKRIANAFDTLMQSKATFVEAFLQIVKSWIPFLTVVVWRFKFK